MNPTPAPAFDIALIWQIAGWAVVGIGGLVLLWALFRDRSRGRRRCPKCWYDMKGVPGLRCPECGREAGHEKKLHKTRRRWRWAAAAALLLLAGMVSLRVPRALEHGWLDAVPLVLLRPALWWERERAEELFKNFYSPTVFGRPSPPLAGLPAAASGPTQWERMLIASAAANRLAPREAETVLSRNAANSHAVQVLAALGREARVAERALRSAAGDADATTAIHWMIVIGPSSGIDFGDDIERFAFSPTAPMERSRALKHSVSLAIQRNKVSRQLRGGITGCAQVASIVGGAIEEAKPPAESRAAVLMLRTLIESADSQVRYYGIESAAHSAAITIRLEETLDRLWRNELPRDVELGYARIIEHLGSRADRWGPRLVTLAESPDLFVRGRALRTLARWASNSGWNDSDLGRWLATADASAPSGAPRSLIPWMQDRLTSTDIHGTEGLAVLVRAAAPHDADADRLLTAVLLKHSASSYRIAAVRELRHRTRNSEAVSAALRQAMKHDDVPAVRQEAIYLLGLTLRDNNVRKEIALAAMNDTDSDVRVRAIGLAESLDTDPEIDAGLRQLAAEPAGRCAETARTVLLRRQAAAAARGDGNRDARTERESNP